MKANIKKYGDKLLALKNPAKKAVLIGELDSEIESFNLLIVSDFEARYRKGDNKDVELSTDKVVAYKNGNRTIIALKISDRLVAKITLPIINTK